MQEGKAQRYLMLDREVFSMRQETVARIQGDGKEQSLMEGFHRGTVQND
jgi:hypothetical protein